MSPLPRARVAFTLIELLVVIGILALLVGILTPTIYRARIIAKRGACQASLRGLAPAFQAYLGDSRDLMPLAARMPSLGLNKRPRIVDILKPYVSGPNALRCPADTRKNYWQREGSSYEYNDFLGGRKVTDNFLTRRLGESSTPVMYDYEPFHGPPNTPGAANYLFADGHVGDLR